MTFKIAFAFTSMILVSTIDGFTEEFTDKIVIRVNTNDLPKIREELERYGAGYLLNILPEFFLFNDSRFYTDKSWLEKAMKKNTMLHSKIRLFERVRKITMHNNGDRVVAAAVSSGEPDISYRLPNCPTYSDMGVEAVWKMDYTGKGIVIAITDAGINTDIPDLHPNIKSELSFNYAANTTDVTPEVCYVGYSSLPDHGNKCAGVVAAVKNNVCGDGVAFESGIAATKIFDLAQDSTHYTCYIHSDTSLIARGLLHKIEQVDVYSNSWGAGKDFIASSETVDNAIEHGIKWGRGGKGAIYVFPADYIADPFANSVHTIAVNSVGTNGRPSFFSKVCACTLTSAYGETNDHHICVMHTTTNERGKCTLDFEGTSASTAIVSGIIGLALQANQNLSWRDVQDLVVKASESEHLDSRNYFQINGAGHRYHPELGFGLLNATKLVLSARTATPLQEQLLMNGKLKSISPGLRQHKPYAECEFVIPCNGTCIHRTESVLIKLTYWSQNESVCELILTSPGGTDSRLIDSKQSKISNSTYRKEKIFKSVNFWGEVAEGTWTLVLRNRINQGNVKIIDCELTIYGTGFKRTSFPPSEYTTTGHVNGSVYTRYIDTNTDEGSGGPMKMIIIIIVLIVVMICIAGHIERQIKTFNRKTQTHAHIQNNTNGNQNDTPDDRQAD